MKKLFIAAVVFLIPYIILDASDKLLDDSLYDEIKEREDFTVWQDKVRNKATKTQKSIEKINVDGLIYPKDIAGLITEHIFFKEPYYDKERIKKMIQDKKRSEFYWMFIPFYQFYVDRYKAAAHSEEVSSLDFDDCFIYVNDCFFLEHESLLVPNLEVVRPSFNNCILCLASLQYGSLFINAEFASCTLSGLSGGSFCFGRYAKFKDSKLSSLSGNCIFFEKGTKIKNSDLKDLNFQCVIFRKDTKVKNSTLRNLSSEIFYFGENSRFENSDLRYITGKTFHFIKNSKVENSTLINLNGETFYFDEGFKFENSDLRHVNGKNFYCGKGSKFENSDLRDLNFENVFIRKNVEFKNCTMDHDLIKQAIERGAYVDKKTFSNSSFSYCANSISFIKAFIIDWIRAW